jgi:serine/threonine-protein kinase RIO1
MFIRKSSSSFYIILVYVDDLNIIDHAKDVDKAHNHFKKEFEMKDLGKIKFYLGLQIEHLQTSIFVESIRKLNMDKAYPKGLP